MSFGIVKRLKKVGNVAKKTGSVIKDKSSIGYRKAKKSVKFSANGVMNAPKRITSSAGSAIGGLVGTTLGGVFGGMSFTSKVILAGTVVLAGKLALSYFFPKGGK